MTIVGSILYADSGSYLPVYWTDSNASPSKLNLGGGGGGGYSDFFVGINSLDQIVSNITYNGNVTPVYWGNLNASPSKLNTAGGNDGRATGINSAGQIVGSIFYEGIGTPVYWPNFSASPITLNVTGGINGAAYGINSLGQIVGAISNEDNISTPVYWENYLASPIKLDLAGGGGGLISDSAFGINNLGQIVGYIVYDGIPIPVYWSNYSASPMKLNFAGGLFGFATGISDPPQPISNICFPAGTPVHTDQGIVNIDRIDKHIHTIRQKPILHVTRTTTLEKYLISIEKDSFGKNVPQKKTLMTKDHKIMFEGRLVPAYRFLDYTDTVKKVKYNGETLYNILLADYGTMNVNNLMCETLHPENTIAKLYLQNYTEHERTTLVHQMNLALVKNDLSTYKYVVHRLTYKM
jgi:hypothetical protein